MRLSTLMHRLRVTAMTTAAVLAAGITTAPAQVINGVYTVDDATNTGPQVFPALTVGNGAAGTLNVFDGRLVRVTSSTRIGQSLTTAVGNGTVTVSGNHSRVDFAGGLQMALGGPNPNLTAIGSLNITAGGHVRASQVGLGQGTARGLQASVNVSGPGSLLEITTFLHMVQNQPPPGLLMISTVTIGTGGTVQVGTVISVELGSPIIILDGGTLSLTGPAAIAASINLQYNSGSFRFRSNQTLDGAAGFYTNHYGSPPVLSAGRGLAIDGTTSLTTPLQFDGGSLRTSRIAVTGAGSILLDGGTLTLTGDGAVIDDGANLETTLLVVGDGAGDPALLELAGGGDVRLGALTIAADGALAFGGETLIISSLDNTGRITVADAVLRVGGSLLNAGSLSLADAVVEGHVTSITGSTIDVAGTVVFNGNVTGAAAFFGSGTAVFNGTLSID